MWYDRLLRILGTSLPAQLEKPAGLVGRYLVRGWLEKGNAALNEFCLGCMQTRADDRVLEIGFGGGATIVELARDAEFVAGVDFSEEMVEAARARNREAIAAGKVDIRNALVSALPFDDASFSKVFTANTIYFWPRPEEDAREIMRVLKPGGKLYIGFRPREIMDRLPGSVVDGRFTKYSPDEVGQLFAEIGFPNVAIESRAENGALDSYCAIVTHSA